MALLQQFFLVLSFFTRLPVPNIIVLGDRTLTKASWAFPLVGALVGFVTGALYLLLLAVHVPYYVAGWIALGGMILLTGGLHEDGLADMADGLAYGRSREEKLLIMSDSRIGSYGVMALMIILAIRAQSMGSFTLSLQPLWVFAAAGACSRALIAVLMHFLPHAKNQGLAAKAGTSSRQQAAMAIGIGLLTLVPLGANAIMLALMLAAIGYMMMRLAEKQFGGSTGDVLGATQQISEAMLLAALCALLPS